MEGCIFLNLSSRNRHSTKPKNPLFKFFFYCQGVFEKNILVRRLTKIREYAIIKIMIKIK